MKTQMRFQKILMIATLIVGALCIVLAVCFCSGTFSDISTIANGSARRFSRPMRECAKSIADSSQNVSNQLLTLGIVAVVLAAVNFITACHSRRKYYITNYISIAATVAYYIALAVMIFVMVGECESYVAQMSTTVGWDAVEQSWNAAFPSNPFEYSFWTPAFAYAVASVFIVNAVVLVLNVAWKVTLMIGEKKLLNASAPVAEEVSEEVA